MNEKLYDSLEVCLQALETGADLESVLKLYPHFADELRPILEASLQARSLAAPSVPDDVMRRGRARVLQHAANMRESARKSRFRSVFAWPRLATSLVLAFIFLLSGTGLVSASNGALPGDNLYPVKRTWEDLRLLFVFSPTGRQELESEYEQERLNEISGLLYRGRYESIAFAGLVTAQAGDQLLVSGITVMLTSSSHLPSEPILTGAPVMVVGHTNAQGFVEADTLELLAPGTSLPPLEPSHPETSTEEDHIYSGENNNVNPLPTIQPLQPQRDEEHDNAPFEFQGVVDAMTGNVWIINGQKVNVESAIIKSQVSVGQLVEFEGYYSNDGQFIVTEIELKTRNNLPGSSKIDQSTSNSSGNSDSNNTVSNDEHETDNDH